MAAAGFLYLDSSALVKLVLREAESDAVVELVRLWPARVSSELAGIEVLRAARRASATDEVLHKAEQVIAGLYLLRIDPEIVRQAARLEPPRLRSLDAIHLATALSLGNQLEAMVVYDVDLSVAATGCGIETLAPGAEREE